MFKKGLILFLILFFIKNNFLSTTLEEMINNIKKQLKELKKDNNLEDQN